MEGRNQMAIKRQVGDFLRLKRLEKKLTLERTASAVGVSINYISKLEKGENSNPSDNIIVNLAKTLDIDEDALFTAFDKIPLSTRKVLMEHPDLSKAISEIENNEKLNDQMKEKFLRKVIYWYKKLSDDENDF